MEKEIIVAEKNNLVPNPPEMFVIRGRRQDDNELEIQDIFLQLRKIIDIKDTVTFQIRLPLESNAKRFFKRSIDLFFSSIIIIGALSWLMPLLALIIKLDSKGPVFFVQNRNKRNGDVFKCIKFRSMVENAEADSMPATFDDERITRVGKFLRRTFLDELPQFFNVWIGDMSLIGPRPHMISDNHRYVELIDFYDYRHKVKPGITGLSQVLGYIGETRNLIAMKNRVQLDIFYVRHWSFWLDLKITWFTLRKIAGL